MKVDDGGPAYPLEYSTFRYEGRCGGMVRTYRRAMGLSLRAYVAAEVMASLSGNNVGDWANDAKCACNAADALIAELKKGAE